MRNESLIEAIAKGIASGIPDGNLTVSEWAAKYRMIPPERVADPALAGQWRNEKTPYLVEIMDAFIDPNVNEIVLMKSAQIGGPLALDTPIPTLDGWKQMSELTLQDVVFDEHGEPTQIIGISETFTNRDCYEITFSDNSTIICDDRHKWTVLDTHNYHKKQVKTLTTTQLKSSYKKGRRNHYAIPVTSIRTEHIELPIAPYLLGVWLGDGNSSSNQITQTPEDAQEVASYINQSNHVAEIRYPKWLKGNTANIIVDKVIRDQECKRGHRLTPATTWNGNCCRECHRQRAVFWKHRKPMEPVIRPKTFFCLLRENGLIQNKHIPPQYLRASYEQRLELLQGLMDSDGTVGTDGRCELTFARESLANDAYELLMTLGIKATIKQRLEIKGFSQGPRKSAPKIHYRISFLVYKDKPVFKLKRKLARMIGRDNRRCSETEHRRIIKIEQVASVPTKCIAVDSDSHLFLAGKSFIPTHNTEALNCILGYSIHIEPSTILYICENEGKARAWSTECFAPLIRDTPVLSKIFGEAKQRDSSNMIESKGFRGGHFALAWSTSPATLSSRPRRVLLRDEIDAFEPTKEGSPLALSEARTKSAGPSRKIIDVSTPRYKETSQIEPRFLDSTAEKYFVPCPHCEGLQLLTWRNAETGHRNLQWDHDEFETVQFFCQKCGEGITEDFKEWMLAHGKWISTNPEYKGNRRGFWICELYSPWDGVWADMAQAYVRCRNNKDELQVFTNTRLAETWEIEGDKLDVMDLRFRQEAYESEVPDGVLVLTAGVDFQADRAEIEVVGWGLDDESWSLDYKVIHGDPTNAENHIWEELADYLGREWQSAEGKPLKVSAAGLDTGFQATNVYKFTKKHSGRRWFAFKGAAGVKAPLISNPTRNNVYRIKLYSIGVNEAKDIIKANLEKQEYGPGYCHFPDDRPASYFHQFANEHKIRRYVGGQPVYRWEKVKDHARNEALDLRVYATAALRILNPDYRTLEQKRYRSEPSEEFSDIAATSAVDRPSSQKSEKPIIKKARSGLLKANRRSGFIKNWR